MPDSGRAGGFGDLGPMFEVTRSTMWTLTAIGCVVVPLLAYVARPDDVKVRRVWAVLCGLAQLIAVIRSPALSALLACWTCIVAMRPRALKAPATQPISE